MGNAGSRDEAPRNDGASSVGRRELQRAELRISGPALYIRATKEIVTCGSNHRELRENWIMMNGGARMPANTEGFITSTHTFVGRRIAARIALASGQVKTIQDLKRGLSSSELAGEGDQFCIEDPNWEIII